MTTLATALNGAAVITTAVAPTLGNINRYNAASGALAVTLPALSGLNVAAWCIVEKDALDGTLNAVTFTCNSGDTFDDALTALSLVPPGEKRVLQVIAISGVKYWKVTGGLNPKTGLLAITSQIALTNSTSPLDLVATNLTPGLLFAGATYRITLDGTIQTSTAASSSLTFTPYIQGTALAQTAVMASTGTANAASAFHLEYLFTVRTIGSSGTAIARPRGIINLATTGVVYLTSTSASATTVNTTAAAGSTALKVAAVWGAANASNSLLVEAATIERVI